MCLTEMHRNRKEDRFTASGTEQHAEIDITINSAKSYQFVIIQCTKVRDQVSLRASQKIIIKNISLIIKLVTVTEIKQEKYKNRRP